VLRASLQLKESELAVSVDVIDRQQKDLEASVAMVRVGLFVARNGCDFCDSGC
jgi:hypothetical protein